MHAATMLIVAMTGTGELSPPGGLDDRIRDVAAELAETHRCGRAFRVEARTFLLKQSLNFETADQGAVMAHEGLTVRHSVTWFHPTAGVLIDDTHPVQRPAARDPHGWLYAGNGMFRIDGDAAEIGCQRPGETAVRAIAAPLVPPYGDQGLRLALESAHGIATLEDKGDEWVVVAGPSEFRVRKGPARVSAWTRRENGAVQSRSRVVAWRTTEFMVAPFPELVLMEGTAASGAVQQTAIVFEAPRAEPNMDASAFRWTKYANIAVDMQTGDRLAMGDSGELVPAPPEPPASRPPAGAAIEYRSDSTGRVVPREGVSPRHWLLVAGVTSLVLAGALAIRRRWA